MKKIAIDLGAGMRKHPNDPETVWLGTDIRPYKDVDYIFDVGKDAFPFSDNSIDVMQAIHLLEHLTSDQLFHCMDEAFRVLKPTGMFHIEVPVFGTQAWNIHPDHKMHWNRDMIGFFQVPADVDRHGYLKGFWHIEMLDAGNPENLSFTLYPNKKGIEKYLYKEVQKLQEDYAK